MSERYSTLYGLVYIFLLVLLIMRDLVIYEKVSMRATNWSDILWGKQAKVIYLMLASALMLLTWLGGREIWTQEHRWADIVSAMFYYRDFLHPSLNGNDYYDKPLLSYWLIVAIATITGKLSVFALRLPSALAGVLAVWAIYRLGSRLKNKSLGLLAGWMLVTTFYFIFWARTSSADMLNMAGTLFAVCWYFEKKSESSFLNYTVFFVILAVTALCKGLVGPMITVLAILPDLLLKNEWKKHLRVSVFFAMIPAAIIYVLPFWASAKFGGSTYGENGLYLVYRENILRYFEPFDHKGPIYTYFIYLPVYLFPWTLFFIPALLSIKSRWKTMSPESKWMMWSVVLLFLFLTLSGSRRNYYVLPIVPFAILLTADWILSGGEFLKRCKWAGVFSVLFFAVFFVSVDLAQSLYYQGGLTNFADKVKQDAQMIKPWNQWQFVMLDPESKVRFYLQLAPNIKNYAVMGKRNGQTKENLQQIWLPVLKNLDDHTIVITRKAYEPILRDILKNYTVISADATWGERILKVKNPNLPVAFIPNNTQVT